METEFKKLADKVIKNKKLQNRKKITIFSFCLLISMFFWTLKKFSKEYQLIVPYKIKFQNLPNDKVLLNNVDTSFFLTIKSQGFNLIYFQLFKKNQIINIDFSNIRLAEGENSNISYLGSTQIIKTIKKQTALDYNIVAAFPDTFALQWEKAFIKIVPVKPLLTLNFQKQYQLYDNLKVIPDSVCISGTYRDINTINSLFTQTHILNNLNASQSIYLIINKPANKDKVRLFADKVKIQIEVEKFTETEIEIPIKIQNNFNKTNVKIFPDKVKVKYLVALKDFKKINSEMFVATINNETLINNDNKAKINLVSYPSNIRISSIYPEKVEFIIFKK